MSVGIYGSKKLSDVTVSDVDVLFAFNASREVIGDVKMQPLFGTLTDSDLKQILGADGVYKLRLPAATFNNLGFYSILIKPKTIQLQILDCSFVVTNDTNQAVISKKGIVIPAAQFQNTGSLVGYQIEYYDTNQVKIKNLSRIITSSDLVSLSTNNTNVAPGSTAYVLDPAGTSFFLTVSPDEPSVISSKTPVDIGSKGQTIDVSNTFFDPLFIEVEMVDTTLQTLGFILTGNSTRDNETGILTYFDDLNNIYRQYNLFTQKKQFSTGTIDVKQQRSIINLNQDFDSISQGLST